MNDSYDEIKYSVAPEDFPDIDSEMLTRKVNELFRPYLFFHKERTGREFWCSACGEHWHTGYNEPVTTNQHMYAMWGEHNDEAVCPACGKSVTMKNTAKLESGRTCWNTTRLYFSQKKMTRYTPEPIGAGKTISGIIRSRRSLC